MSAWADDAERAKWLYERLLVRSNQTNALQWQTPGLALAAQAFLLTIGLRVDGTAWSTGIASCLGVLITFMVMHSMSRHRYYFQLDQAEMRRLEKLLKIPPLADRAQQQLRHATVVGGLGKWLGSSYRGWMIGFTVIAILDVAVLVIRVVFPHWLLVD